MSSICTQSCLPSAGLPSTKLFHDVWINGVLRLEVSADNCFVGIWRVLPSRGMEFEGSLLPTRPCITICRGSFRQGGNIQPYSLLVEEYQQLSSKRFEKCNVIHLYVYLYNIYIQIVFRLQTRSCPLNYQPFKKMPFLLVLGFFHV